MEELWKPVIGFEGLYEVSNLGNIRSLDYRRTGSVHNLKPKKYPKGYLGINLYKDKVAYTLYIHILILSAFIENPENKPTVNHKDGITSNNRLDNLEWATYSENHLHAFRCLNRIPSCKGIFGSDSHLSKKVNQLCRSGEFIKEWGSIVEAAKELNISQSHISSCCSGRVKTIGGYIWELV